MEDKPLRTAHDVHVRHYLEPYRRMLTAHPEVATLAGLHFCRTENIIPPQWLALAATSIVPLLLEDISTLKRGRCAGYVARYRQDFVHADRWWSVITARNYQKEFARRVSLLEEYEVPKSERLHDERMLDWYGTDWYRAYECAALLLRGTPSYAGPDAMKASYQKVQRELKDPRNSHRYFRVHESFLPLLGIPRTQDLHQDTKFTHLYNLTL